MTPLVMMNNIRSPNFPNVPLLTEVGYNGPPSRSWYGLFAPAGTPKPIVDKLSKEIGAASSAIRPSASAISPRAASCRRQHAGAVRRGDQGSERAVAEKVVKDAGLEPQ